MSDAQVQAHLDQLERWLSDPQWLPDPAAMADWDAGFHAAVSSADRGPGWDRIVQQGRALQDRMEARSTTLAIELEQVRTELQQQVSGSHALKAYQPTQS